MGDNSWKAPADDQKPKDVERWLRENVRLGAEVAIRHTQHNQYRYELARVIRLGRGRFHVSVIKPDGTEGNAEGFYYSGANCWHPKGQTTLVIPTAEVRIACEWCAKMNRGFTYGWTPDREY